jgi:hypothetical protein
MMKKASVTLFMFLFSFTSGILAQNVLSTTPPLTENNGQDGIKFNLKTNQVIQINAFFFSNVFWYQ